MREETKRRENKIIAPRDCECGEYRASRTNHPHARAREEAEQRLVVSVAGAGGGEGGEVLLPVWSRVRDYNARAPWKRRKEAANRADSGSSW